MADIDLRSRQAILGSMIARIKADTDINDVFPGSVILTILEAAASSDFLTESKLLQLLNVRSIDKATGLDLENLAFEMGISPTRIGSTPSQAALTVYETSFSKVASNIYAGSTAPASGDTLVRIVSSVGFNPTGTVYLGRGTSTSESVNYTSINNTGSYSELTLAAPLQKNHLVGEEVVLAQGGDRLVPAGTTAQAAGQSGLAGVTFTTQFDVTLYDGEDTISGILAIASEPGTQGNVGRNKIVSFQGAPWSTAAVKNNDPAQAGADPETDSQLRQRIKDHVHSLSGGTERAIVRAVVGTFDEQDNKRVVSAFLKKPTSTSESTILFIDDGTGFAPSFSGIGEEVIITSAIGTEQFVQLQQWPLVKSQVASVATEPFNLTGTESLYVEVDGLVEERALPVTSYRTPGVASAQEVAEAINKWFTTIEARAKDGQLFITPTSDDPDWIRIGVATLGGGDVNSAVRFPTKKQYTIRLYKNDVLLEKNGSAAIAQSLPNSQWTGLTPSENLQLNVDGIDSPTVSFSDVEFLTYTSSSTIAGATVNDWVIMINRKFIGITAAGRDDGTFTVKSNRGATDVARVAIIGGSLAQKLFPANSVAQGKAPEYKVNRLLGQIELASRMKAGDELKAGNTNTRGFALTSAQAAFSLSSIGIYNPEMVVVADAPYISVQVAQLGNISLTIPATGVTRLTGTAGQFANVKKDDFAHLYNLPRHALLRVVNVASDSSYVEFADPSPQGGSATLDGSTNHLRFFRTSGLPQILVLPSGTQVLTSQVVSAVNSQILGVFADVTDTGAVRIQTTRFSGDGALSIPSIAGNAANLGILEAVYKSNDPHTATVESDLLGGTPSKRITIQTPDNTAPFVNINAAGNPFDSKNSNTALMTYLGSASRIIREPSELISTSQMILRGDLPLQRVGNGPDLRATTLSGMEFGQADNMVFLMDNDPARKTFDIPMYVDAKVAGPSVPSSTQMDLSDSTGALLGSSSRWLGHRFEDYRAWFQAKNDLSAINPNAGIRIASVPFGPNGEKVKAGILYPTQPNSPAQVSFSVDSVNSQILVNITLASQDQRQINLQPNRRVDIENLGASLYRFYFLGPVDLTPVVIGDVLSLSDSQFNVLNQGEMCVSAIQNLTDVGHGWTFVQEQAIGDVSGGTLITLHSAPNQPARIGDTLTYLGLTKAVTSVDAPNSKVVVDVGSNFQAAPGQFVVNSITYGYTSYTQSTGTFTGITPSPAGIPSGANLFQASTGGATHTITAVSGTTLTIDSAFADGSGETFQLKHASLTISGIPSFSPTINDRIQMGSIITRITAVYSSTEFGVDLPFSWTGTQSATLSRIYVEGRRYNAGPSESHQVQSAASIRLYNIPNADNKASVLIAAVNATAGVKDVVSAKPAPGNDGSGVVSVSTEDQQGNGNKYVSLKNGESFVYSTGTTSPAIRLKTPIAVAPDLGESVRLVPTTARNVADHFSRKQISGLTVAANVALVDEGRRVQVSSTTPGGLGQVYAVGGRASGQNVLVIRGNAQEINASSAQLELDKSSIELLIPGHTIKITQLDRAKKRSPVSAPTASDTITIQIPTPGYGQLVSSSPLVNLLSYTQTGSPVWAVRNIGRSRVRYELISGTANLPAALQADDWVLIGNGISYAGITTDTPFAPANRGWFQVRETDNANYFDVESTGVEEFVTSTSNSMLFCSYHSARPGDQLVIGFDSPVSTANKGTFIITSVPSASTVQYQNVSVELQASIALGLNGAASIGILDQGYSTYRKVVMVAPKPSDPTNRSLVVVTPGYNMSLFSEGQAARVNLPNRLNYGSDPVPGTSGYSFWTGLKRRVQRVVDGYEPDPASYPGVGAAGVTVEVREPQIQRVKVGLKIKTAKGVSLQALSDTIKSAIDGYVNSLGLGADVVMSEIISIVQNIPGIDSCVLVLPSAGTERITVGNSSIARINTNDITLS